MLGWLLARAGIEVVVLEKHADFFRDFRGDTVHPSTLELMHEVGVLEARGAAHPARAYRFRAARRAHSRPELAKLPTHCKYMALMPQWDFLDFVRREASRYPHFRLMMEPRSTSCATATP